MGYPTASTEWPSVATPAPVKNLIDSFFLLADDTSSSAGDGMADKVFASDAVILNGGKRTEGTAQIRRSRDHAWDLITKRHHEVLKVFTSGAEADDLLLIGLVQMDFKNGKSISSEFIARVKVSGADSSEPKIKLYQVWADSAPVTAALQSN